MAGDWIKVEKDTPEKQEVLAIAAALNLDPEIVFTKCFKLWRWADSNTVDGRIPKVTSVIVDALVHSTGFAQALIEVGWLQVREGSLVIPHFGRHMGQPAKKRAQHRKRGSKPAKKLKPDDSEGVCACALPALYLRENDPTSSLLSYPPESLDEGGGEKVGNGAKRSRDGPLLPSNIDTPEFRAAWSEWQQFRAERRSSLTPSTVRKQLTLLSREGPARAVEMIGRSILNGWMGLYPEKTGGSNGTANGNTRPGVGSGVRISTPKPSLDAINSQTIRIGGLADPGCAAQGGLYANGAHPTERNGH